MNILYNKIIQKNLNICRTNIDECKQLLASYMKLKDFLLKSGQKLKKEIMIPINNIALIPGELYKTNEVLMLHGDNWFSKLSTYEALSLIECRIAKINDKIICLQHENDMLEHKLSQDFLPDIFPTSNVVEIKEEYDEIKEKEWRIKHKQNITNYYKDVQRNKLLDAKNNCSSLEDADKLPKKTIEPLKSILKSQPIMKDSTLYAEQILPKMEKVTLTPVEINDITETTQRDKPLKQVKKSLSKFKKDSLKKST